MPKLYTSTVDQLKNYCGPYWMSPSEIRGELGFPPYRSDPFPTPFFRIVTTHDDAIVDEDFTLGWTKRLPDVVAAFHSYVLPDLANRFVWASWGLQVMAERDYGEYFAKGDVLYSIAWSKQAGTYVGPSWNIARSELDAFLAVHRLYARKRFQP